MGFSAGLKSVFPLGPEAAFSLSLATTIFLRLQSHILWYGSNAPLTHNLFFLRPRRALVPWDPSFFRGWGARQPPFPFGPKPPFSRWTHNSLFPPGPKQPFDFGPNAACFLCPQSVICPLDPRTHFPFVPKAVFFSWSPIHAHPFGYEKNNFPFDPRVCPPDPHPKCRVRTPTTTASSPSKRLLINVILPPPSRYQKATRGYRAQGKHTREKEGAKKQNQKLHMRIARIKIEAKTQSHNTKTHKKHNAYLYYVYMFWIT